MTFFILFLIDLLVSFNIFNLKNTSLFSFIVQFLMPIFMRLKETKSSLAVPFKV